MRCPSSSHSIPFEGHWQDLNLQGSRDCVPEYVITYSIRPGANDRTRTDGGFFVGNEVQSPLCHIRINRRQGSEKNFDALETGL